VLAETEQERLAMSSNMLSIRDNRTGKQYEVQIRPGAIAAAELRRIRISEEDAGLMSYDPAYVNTASCQSRITMIDGEQGSLHYRGYPIEQLAEQCCYLEVSYLLLHGALPSRRQLNSWMGEVRGHTMLPGHSKKLLAGFRRYAQPMGMLVSTVAALSTFYSDSRGVEDPEGRKLQAYRLVSKMPTIAAYAYRHNQGLPFVSPDKELSYIRNLMNMMFKTPAIKYRSDPVLERALDILLVLHADHEQNCSTNVMRSVGSSHADPYLCTAAAAAALSGPLHGGANTQVWRMLRKIGSKQHVPEYIRRVKAEEVPLLGFGHRVYKNYDPRARIIKQVAREILQLSEKDSLLGIALELEKIVLEDDYFISRRLYPKVELYSGIVYHAIGFPVEMFPVLFAVARTTGWLAHWEEMLQDPEQKMARPRQLYLGPGRRDVLPIESRTDE
jgi:citrate synthase